MLSLVSTNHVSIPTPTFKQNRIIAAIDLGTNSLHMVVVKLTLPYLLLALLPEKKKL